jgi:phage terminase large subunit-like protein
VEPRLETVVVGDGSLAPSVFDAADEMGVVLDGWQRYAVERLFTTVGDRLAARTGLISVARQNGKTTLAETVMYWWLSRQPFGPDAVLVVSHDLKLTSIVYDRVVAYLGAHGHLAQGSRGRKKATYSHGRQTATMANGSTFSVQADTPSAGHGYARVGLVVGDEIWGVHDTAWDHGLLPTQRVHPSPLALMLSTAGDESSALFRRWREKGLALVDSGRPSSFLMLEWSLPAGVDPSDPVWWGWANPCLGDRLPLATLVEESEAPDRTAFLRASLNMWVASAKAWLDPGVWDALRADVGELAGGWVAAEVSATGNGSWRCGPRPGRTASSPSKPSSTRTPKTRSGRRSPT